MGFKPAKNIPGRVYVPCEAPEPHKKHTCPDCYQCQMCGEDRCGVCRAGVRRPAASEAAAGACCGIERGPAYRGSDQPSD